MNPKRQHFELGDKNSTLQYHQPDSDCHFYVDMNNIHLIFWKCDVWYLDKKIGVFGLILCYLR